MTKTAAYLLGAALALSGCDGSSPLAPSENSPAPTNQVAAQSDPVEIDRRVERDEPEQRVFSHPMLPAGWTGDIDGPSGCLDMTEASWEITITEASARGGHVVAAAFRDDEPGCAATTRHNAEIFLTGTIEYPPRGAGITELRYRPDTNCGRVQVDTAIDDGSNGDRVTIVTAVLNTGVSCPVPAPPPPPEDEPPVAPPAPPEPPSAPPAPPEEPEPPQSPPEPPEEPEPPQEPPPPPPPPEEPPPPLTPMCPVPDLPATVELPQSNPNTLKSWLWSQGDTNFVSNGRSYVSGNTWTKDGPCPVVMVKLVGSNVYHVLRLVPQGQTVTFPGGIEFVHRFDCPRGD